MVYHLPRIFKRSVALWVIREASRPQAMIADAHLSARVKGSPQHNTVVTRLCYPMGSAVKAARSALERSV